ncbi:YegS/Rv2252/BmrU family lipid kinase [Elusimicrobium posterum]|uniref:diacylglycerol/lipid kinase family protein n=1 Tax=Elusimicrobium posterum TaxID=3116653 RepID=UPI003C74078B
MMLFIVNPKSGAKKDGEHFVSLIKKHFPEAEITFTERAGHAIEIARDAAAKNYEKVIACGGDGTINETARGLMHTNTALGVIPRGSGNGFAREVGMPLNAEKALLKLKETKVIDCDLGQINDDIFINVAGVGIEAEIAHKFATYGKRGMLPYFWIGLKTVFTFKPAKLKVTADGKEFETAPLTLVFANGRQYGSDFFIAPDASLTDGLFDMVELPKRNLFVLLFSLPSFMSSHIKTGRVTKVTKVKEAQISLPHPLSYHVDGEPKMAENTLHVKLLQGAIKLLA